MIPSSGSPKAMKNSTTVSGQFRIIVTYAVPKPAGPGPGRPGRPPAPCPSTRDPTIAAEADPQGPQEPGQ